MTGHQNHPGTGETLMGSFGPIIKPEDVAKACGVKNVVVVDPYKVKETRKVVRELLAKNEPAVIINRRACALHIRLHNPPFVVDAEKCNGCKTCISLGCPALSFGENRDASAALVPTVPGARPTQPPGGSVPDFPTRGKAHIAETICVGCGMCADVCPKEAIAQGTNDKGAMTKDEGLRTKSATGGAV
jgi:TPP-dependent indolepyruvate ferredoxin oxidoreductase alpha subunit